MTSATAGPLLWALVLLPALVGSVLLLAARRLGGAAGGVGVATAAVTAGLAAAVAVWRPSVGVPFVAGSDLALAVDGLAAVVAPTVAVVTLLVLLAAAADVHESRARFHGLMLLFAAAVLLTVTATTLPTLLLAWEVMGGTSYALIGFRWREQHRVGSGLTAFVTTRAADLGLYAAAGAAVAGGAGLDLDALPSATSGWRDVIALGVLVAALGKAAQLVLAFWLSRAMDGPSPVSALLHSAAMVAMGGYLLLRLEPLLAATGWAATTAAWAGALTAVVLGLVALGQEDLKQLLAASTSAQLGYVVMAAGLGATAAGTAHLVAHAATKAGLFLAAGAWLSALGTKQLDGLRGTVGGWPVVRVAASVALLALAGVPPLSLWATKDLVLAAAMEHSVALYAVGTVGALLSAAYAGAALRVLWAPVGEEERRRAATLQGTEEEPGGVVPTAVTAAVVTLAAGAAVLGLLAAPGVVAALGRAVGGTVTEPTAPELVGSALLAALGLGVVWRRPPPRPRWALSWLGLERGANLAVVRPTLALARALDRADIAFSTSTERVVRGLVALAARLARADDGLAGRVDGAAHTTAAVAVVSGRADDRWVDGAVRAVVRRVRQGGALARRPQTGLLHQYYVQAVALVAAGAALVLVVR